MLNCSESAAIKCSPYKVVFGRNPTLPVAMLFTNHAGINTKDVVTLKMYADEMNVRLADIWELVIKHLNLSKIRMTRQYNTKLRFHDHQENQKMWLKRKVIKSGENK